MNITLRQKSDIVTIFPSILCLDTIVTIIEYCDYFALVVTIRFLMYNNAHRVFLRVK